jgi:hypothetical protein
MRASLWALAVIAYVLLVGAGYMVSGASTAVQVSNQLGKIGKGGRSPLNVGGLKQSLAFRQALPIRSEI